MAGMGDTYIGPAGNVTRWRWSAPGRGLQLMLDGVRPQTMKDRLEYLAQQPMQPKKRQKPCDIGSFDTESRRQLEFFWLLSSTGRLLLCRAVRHHGE
jgi:hypothetical protein